jgi:hypothetical protein
MAVSLALLLTGCIPSSFAQTPYQQAVGDAAALFVSSATVIEQVHEDELDRRYADSTLALYRAHLEELPAFAGLRGAPESDEPARLAALLEDTTFIVIDPCLEDGCDWQGQVETLRQASTTFEEAGQ